MLDLKCEHLIKKDPEILRIFHKAYTYIVYERRPQYDVVPHRWWIDDKDFSFVSIQAQEELIHPPINHVQAFFYVIICCCLLCWYERF